MFSLILPMLLGASFLSAAFLSVGDGDNTADDQDSTDLDENSTASGDLLDEFGVPAGLSGTNDFDDGSNDGGGTYPDDVLDGLPSEPDTTPPLDDEGDSPQVEYGVDARGHYVGSDSNDTISVDVEAPENPFLSWYGDSINVSFDIRGGEGDDSLSLSGSGYTASTDQGSDTIDLGDAFNVAVYGGEGDTIIGGTGSNVFVSITDDATFVGGDSDDCVQSTSSSTMHLGDGEDSFIGADQNTAEHVFGDDGNDYLIGSIRSPSDLWAVHEGDQSLISHDCDTLDGGAGDDTLVGSHGDILIGGAGSDSFTAILDHAADAEPVVVEDFSRTEDILFIHYNLDDAGTQVSPEDFTHVVTPAGDLEIASADGQVLALVKGVTDLTIGISHWDEATDSFQTVDLNGNQIEQSLCNVIISNQIAEFGI